MKNYLYKLFSFAVVAVFIISCEPEINVPAPQTGGADFSKYVAVGNSLTAGIADNGFYAEAQANSYPSILAKQMNEIVPFEFIQPDVQGYGSGYLYVSSLDLSKSPPDVEFGFFAPDPNWLTQITGPFNNLGVDGIRVKDITVPGYGASPTTGNPFFYRMLGGKPANTSYLQMVQESAPTFFTSWLGNNDALGYATTGGVYGVAGLPGSGLGGLTNPMTEFKPSYDALMAALTAGGAKGVLLTIPDITAAPFFTTVPWNGIVIDAATATLANQYYSAGIDTAIASKVIQQGVTEQAIMMNVIPSLAQQAVYQQAYAAAKAGGASDAEAAAAAAAYVASAEGQAAIAQTVTALNAELRNHLLGVHTAHASLEPLYAVIDQQLATNTTLQQGIAQGIISTKTAYYAELQNHRQGNHSAHLTIEPIYVGVEQTISSLKSVGIYPVFAAGANGFVIEVAQNQSNPLGIRQMKAGEYVLLTALLDGELEGLQALAPKANQYILTTEEVANITSYTNQYNDIIRSYAGSDIAILDANDMLQEVKEGIFMDGVSVDASFLLGGAFSLDGVHLTPRGYAIVANGIIKTINSKFGSTISPVNINNYRAVILP